MFKRGLLACAIAALASHGHAQTQTLKIGVIAGNPDLQRLERLSSDFMAQNPDIRLEWEATQLPALMSRLAIAASSGTSDADIVILPNQELISVAKAGFLAPLQSQDSWLEDHLKSAVESVTLDGHLYGAPFLVETWVVLFRRDVVDSVGVTMPRDPSWQFLKEAAEKLDSHFEGQGICLPGKPDSTDLVDVVGAIASSFGAPPITAELEPEHFRLDAWRSAVRFYGDLIDHAPPTPSSNGFFENLSLFQAGQCGIWIAPSFAGAAIAHSGAAGDVGFALLPGDENGRRGTALSTLSFVIPGTSRNHDLAQRFIFWATSAEYSRLVADKDGWASVPLGTLSSVNTDLESHQAVPIAAIFGDAIAAAAVDNTGVPGLTKPKIEIAKILSASLGTSEDVDSILSTIQSLWTEYRVAGTDVPSPPGAESPRESIGVGAPQEFAGNDEAEVETAGQGYTDEGWPIALPSVEGITPFSHPTPSPTDSGQVLPSRPWDLESDAEFVEALASDPATGRLSARFFRQGFPDAILIKRPGASGHVCTGTLLVGEFVLTAAHCATDFEDGGAAFLLTPDQATCVSEQGADLFEDANVETCKLQPLELLGISFGGSKGEQQLALVRIPKQSVRSSDIRAIYGRTSAVVTFTGFGFLGLEPRTHAGTLEVTWGSLELRGAAPTNLADTNGYGYDFKGVTACGGDSGGALYLGRVFGYADPNIPEEHELIGVVTAGADRSDCTVGGDSRPIHTFVTPVGSDTALEWLCKETGDALTICGRKKKGTS